MWKNNILFLLFNLSFFFISILINPVFSQSTCGNGLVEPDESCDDANPFFTSSNFNFESDYFYWQITNDGGVNETTEFSLFQIQNETEGVLRVIEGNQSLLVSLGPNSGSYPSFPITFEISQQILISYDQLVNFLQNPNFSLSLRFQMIISSQLATAVCSGLFVAGIHFYPSNESKPPLTSFTSTNCGTDLIIDRWFNQNIEILSSSFNTSNISPVNQIPFTLSFGFMQPESISSGEYNLIIDNIMLISNPLSPPDGCDDYCKIERGWNCQENSEPSLCFPLGTLNSSNLCGNGFIDLLETCDDANSQTADGCEKCQITPGFSCENSPSVCTSICGDNFLTPNEDCDDGNIQNNDGCTENCFFENGWTCKGQPSICQED